MLPHVIHLVVCLRGWGKEGTKRNMKGDGRNVIIEEDAARNEPRAGATLSSGPTGSGVSPARRSTSPSPCRISSWLPDGTDQTRKV